MKKYIFSIIMVSMILLSSSIYGEESNENKTKTVDESIELANKYLEDNGIISFKFGRISLTGKSINETFATTGHLSFDGQPILVYGSEVDGTYEATLYGNDTRKTDAQGDSRALGFSITGCPYPNPEFFIDDINYVRRWIKEPWLLPNAVTKGITKQLVSDNKSDTHTTQWLDFQPNTFASTYSVINQWIRSQATWPSNVTASGKSRDFLLRNLEAGVPDAIKDHPEDFIYVVQPATYYAWGIGIAYYYYGNSVNDYNRYFLLSTL